MEHQDRHLREMHPVDQVVRSIQYYNSHDGMNGYTVGRNGVTKIEPTYKCGEMSYIPYFRVWAGEKALAEICQHKIDAVYYD